MGTLYIDRKELHIRLDGQALAFYINGEREGLAMKLKGKANPLHNEAIVSHIKKLKN